MTNTDPMVAASELLTLAEAAEYLNVTERFILRCRYEQRLAYVKLGKHLRFRRTDLDAFVEAQRHPASAGGGA